MVVRYLARVHYNYHPNWHFVDNEILEKRHMQSHILCHLLCQYCIESAGSVFSSPDMRIVIIVVLVQRNSLLQINKMTLTKKQLTVFEELK